MNKKILGISIIICLMTLVFAPVMNALSIPKNHSKTTDENDLIDGVDIRGCSGTGFYSFYNWWFTKTGDDNSTAYLFLTYQNNNHVGIIHLDTFITIMKLDGSSGMQFIDNDEYGFDTGSGVWRGILPTHGDLVEHNYLTSFFKVNIKFTVREDGSSITKLYTGIFLIWGSIIFNPRGKVIE